MEFQPTAPQRRRVEAMSAVGIPQEQIALTLGCSTKTLRKHFRHELDVAAAQANAQVAGRLFKLAMDGDVVACIFWMKARCGWSDRVNVHHTVGPGMSHEERLAQLEADPFDQSAGMLDGTAVEVRDEGESLRESANEKAAAA